MKKIISLAFVVLGLAQASYGATFFAGIRGSVENPTTSSGASLADGTFAALIVDVSGQGLNLSSSVVLQEGVTYGNLYVASIFAASNSFAGEFATSPITQVSWESTGNLATLPSTGDKYYVVWFTGLTGATNDSTQVSIANGQAYGYASGAAWLVPADGGTVTPPSVSSGFTFAVVPEPSVTLLGAIGGLALLRRRRN